MAKASQCCSLKRGIRSTGLDCTDPTGGAYDVRIACKKDVILTYRSSTAERYGFVDSNEEPTAEESFGDARIIKILGAPIDMDDENPTPAKPFYRVEARDQTVEHVFDETYDNDTGNTSRTESLTMDIEVKSREVYSAMAQYLGHEVVVLFREKGSDRWYCLGRSGGMVVTGFAGGTGTTDFTPTTLTISGDNLPHTFDEVLYYTVDAADPMFSIGDEVGDPDGTTSALDLLTAA